ncbi:MAG: hypothetical protein IPH84_10625 [Bacteroidales bacterium]|nr:hypothetical protein [Bacteroidales bacterium]
MSNSSNGEEYDSNENIEKSVTSKASTFPQILAQRLEQVDSIINRLSSKIDSDIETGCNSEEISPLIYYCDVPECWPKEIYSYNYLLCDRMQMPCLQFPSRILCSKWHQLHDVLVQELTSALNPLDIPQSYEQQIRFWENEILPIVKSSFYDTIYNEDGNLVPDVFSQDQSINHNSSVLTIYPHNIDEIKAYNNKKYNWFQTFEMNWLQKYTDSDLSYPSMISELKMSFDSILSEHLNPSYPVIKIIDEYIDCFKELIDALEKYEPELLTLNRNTQIIQNITSFYVFRQVPDFIGFLEELKNKIQKHPSKTREIITKTYNSVKSLNLPPSMPEINCLLDIWEGGAGSFASYNRVIRYYQTKINYEFDKPLINQDGTWARGRASKSFLQAFIKTCIKKGHVRDSNSSAELARILKNTFKLNTLSPTGYTSQNLELIERNYLDFFSDMPE